jgi:D-alanyl-D-alanine carboxypeptidase/D-alanyl-D-alanine-endopeptidase (penicillin-binding protein 4)
VRIVSEKQDFTPVLTLFSPPLVQIIEEINHESVNLFAEHLVLQLALENSGKGNMQEGLKLIEAFWKKKGAEEPVFLEDGSGLSRYNAISAQFLVKVLTHMHDSNNGVLFRSSLPSAGNGTLTGFSGTDFPGETLRCKSGSMERVRGYAGYLQCISGRQLAFAVLVNNFPATSGDVMREIMELLKELRKNY